jgi:hypothetical protein
VAPDTVPVQCEQALARRDSVRRHLAFKGDFIDSLSAGDMENC